MTNFGLDDVGSYACVGSTVIGSASAGFEIQADRTDTKHSIKKG